MPKLNQAFVLFVLFAVLATSQPLIAGGTSTLWYRSQVESSTYIVRGECPYNTSSSCTQNRTGMQDDRFIDAVLAAYSRTITQLEQEQAYLEKRAIENDDAITKVIELGSPVPVDLQRKNMEVQELGRQMRRKFNAMKETSIELRGKLRALLQGQSIHLSAWPSSDKDSLLKELFESAWSPSVRW